MPGFLGIIGDFKTDKLFSENSRDDLINKKLISDDIYIEQRTIKKFHRDKVFEENDDYFILTEGVILNSIDLINRYNVNSLSEAVIIMYEKNGNDFFKEFRGSFSGVLYDKRKNIKIIYTDHIGDKQLFYSRFDNKIVFGSELNYITEYFNKNKMNYTLSKKSAYFLLTYGYMIEDNTLFNEIKKLIAGNYILIKDSKLEVIQYYKLDNTPNNNQSENEIINNIDKLFRQAIKRAFDKDIEYGYKHLVALSGGLDSRMTTWVASNMGYRDNIINFTFSQSEYLDEIIPKKIAADLRHEWIFKSLDNGLFLKKIDDVVKISSGGALYYGLAHGKSCLDLIDTRKFGIVHSGQLGDVVLGTFYSSLDKDKSYSLTDGMYSKLLSNKLDESSIKLSYENEEIFKFYERGFTGANQGLLIYQETNETYSPFYDIDFLEYCIKIPVEYRYKHEIYFKWILSKYPEASAYKWEKINGKITDKRISILGKKVILKQIHKKALKYLKNKLKLNTSSLSSKNHMNPLDYWYDTNKDLKKFMDKYFNDNIDRLSFDSELSEDCTYLYRNGSNIEKNQVLTLLAVLKLYF